MNTREPFTLTVPLDPDRDSDATELARAADLIDDLLDRPRLDRVPGHFDVADAFARIAAYQAARGLRVDRRMNPDGPTEKRLAAEQHLRSRAVPRKLGPFLEEGVGLRQPNRPEDVRAISDALTLAGQAGEERSLAQRLAAFQTAHGESPDGVAVPAGATEDLLRFIAAPDVARHERSRSGGTLPDHPQHEAAERLLKRSQQLRGRNSTIRPRLAQGRGHVGGVPGGGRFPSLNEQDFIGRSYGVIPKHRPDMHEETDDRGLTEEQVRQIRKLIADQISDPQKTPGRPKLTQGDPYSGNDTYGDADGR